MISTARKRLNISVARMAPPHSVLLAQRPGFSLGLPVCIRSVSVSTYVCTHAHFTQLHSLSFNQLYHKLKCRLWLKGRGEVETTAVQKAMAGSCVAGVKYRQFFDFHRARVLTCHKIDDIKQWDAMFLALN